MSETTIEWTAIPGYPNFAATSDGRIRGPRSELRPMVQPSGHLYVLAYNCRPKKLFVHRAVLLAFVGPCPTGAEGRHLNDDPTDNRLENLAWGTRLENMADQQRNGRRKVGENRPSARLTEEQVRRIRTLYGTLSLRKLGAKFGVSHTVIRRAAIGRSWGHVTA